MPDWFYRTVSRPLLFRLPSVAARDFSLGLMGRLARMPLGSRLIDLLGHMSPDPRLRRTLLSVPFPSAVGLGPGLDINAVALPALARFGFGFLEVGPVTAAVQPSKVPVERRVAEQALWYPDPPATLGATDLAQRLARAGPLPVPIMVRLGYQPGPAVGSAVDACQRVVEELAPFAALFSLALPRPAIGGEWEPVQWRLYLQAILQMVGAGPSPRPMLVCVPTDGDEATFDRLVRPALDAGAGGVILDGSVRVAPSGRLAGLPAREAALLQVSCLRRFGETTWSLSARVAFTSRNMPCNCAKPGPTWYKSIAA
jgi:dihydroorotate dehydrogenase